MIRLFVSFHNINFANKTYLGTMLPPTSRNMKLIYPNCMKLYSTTFMYDTYCSVRELRAIIVLIATIFSICLDGEQSLGKWKQMSETNQWFVISTLFLFYIFFWVFMAAVKIALIMYCLLPWWVLNYCGKLGLLYNFLLF